MTTLTLDFIFVGISVVGILILGTLVFLNNRKSITNVSFFYFSIAASFWGIFNYLNYQFRSPELILWSLRAVIFFAVWYSFFLFQFLFVFPLEHVSFSKKYKYLLVPIVAVTSIINLTNLVFPSIAQIGDTGQVSKTVVGHGIFLFITVVVFLVGSGIYLLIKKIRAAVQAEKPRLKLVFWGVLVTFLLHLIFNLILPAVFLNVSFIPLGALFTFPFIILTFYAIIKHKLFNVRVIATELITFILWSFILIRTIFSINLQDSIINGILLIVLVIIGILLISSVMKEVKQRERLEILTGQLENANDNLETLIKQRESLMHLITHKVKGSFTHSKYIFAGILDGTFGAITPELQQMAEKGLESDNAGINTVDLVLNTANMQKGLVKYEMKKTDFKDLVLSVFSEKKIPAEKEGLQIERDIKEGDYFVMGDSFWLKEAINNLIENSLKYTKEGKIIVGLEKKGDKIIFSVKDTGVGLTPEDNNILFTEGGRGHDSVKVNVDSTGYGLYTVKLVVEAHKGRVWAESGGVGQGSQFYIELDAIK